MCEFLTILEAADDLRVSQSTIRRLIGAKKLVAVSITGAGGCVRLTQKSLEEYKAKLLGQCSTQTG